MAFSAWTVIQMSAPSFIWLEKAEDNLETPLFYREISMMSHSKHDQTAHRGEEMKGPVWSVPRAWRPLLWPCHPPSCPPARWPSVRSTPHRARHRPRTHENLYLCSLKNCLPFQSRKVSEFWSPATLPKESSSALQGKLYSSSVLTLSPGTDFLFRAPVAI